jgi:hypothetical protein
MTTKSTFSALGAPMSLAWVHGILHVEGSTLPKSVESGKLSLDKAGIRWMSGLVKQPVLHCKDLGRDGHRRTTVRARG